MKLLITLLALTLSMNAFSYSITDSTVLTSASPLISSASTSEALQKAQAAAVINDSQEYLSNGKLSVFLADKIKLAQEVNEGASESEALEMLLNEATAILK